MVAPISKPFARFALGTVCATTGALDALNQARQNGSEFLTRHQSGDWGEVCPDDAKANEQAIQEGERILSAYTLKTGEKLWIITESDRSATTLLRPLEY